MSEADIIDRALGPISVEMLVDDLVALGVGAGSEIIVHSSLSKLGWVAGGAQSVVEALLTAVGPKGTVIMPTQSGQMSDPIRWQHPPLPAEWVEVTRQSTPAFDPYLTPTRMMGQVVECFRQHRGTIRSNHPTFSFAANGPGAKGIVGNHPLTPGFGETSPLARLYERGASVLLLGVNHANNTSLHLAETRSSWPGKTTYMEGSPILVDGERQWVEYEELVHEDGDFAAIGADLALTNIEVVGPAGRGEARLGTQSAIVDFAVDWIQSNR